MDYKEKYEKALERAKVIFERACSDEGKDIIMNIFPEIKNEKDEEIRQTIVSILQQYDKICEKEGDPCIDLTACYNWLDEHKPSQYDEAQSIDYLCSWPTWVGCTRKCIECFAKCLYRKKQNPNMYK